jgi:hypothetical protein
MGIAAVALISSVGIASAADPAGSQSSLPKASASQANDSLTLTSAQERTIWQTVRKENASIKTPAGFSAKVGEKVPGAVTITPLPTSVTNTIAAVRPYEYALLDNKQLLIVNPTDKTVVDIITPSGASG